MSGYLKRTAMILAGLCFIAFGLLAFLFIYAYVIGGAGLQIFGFFLPVSPITIAIGVVHFIGFSAAGCLCFLIGMGLIAYGVTSEKDKSISDEMEGASHRG